MRGWITRCESISTYSPGYPGSSVSRPPLTGINMQNIILFRELSSASYRQSTCACNFYASYAESPHKSIVTARVSLFDVVSVQLQFAQIQVLVLHSSCVSQFSACEFCQITTVFIVFSKSVYVIYGFIYEAELNRQFVF